MNTSEVYNRRSRLLENETRSEEPFASKTSRYCIDAAVAACDKEQFAQFLIAHAWHWELLHRADGHLNNGFAEDNS